MGEYSDYEMKPIRSSSGLTGSSQTDNLEITNQFTNNRKASVSESRQIAALLEGVNLALYMTNRLKAYREYLRYLPASVATVNFYNSLTIFYALILQFLADAIQIYERSSAARALHTFWKPDTIRHFESECDKIGQRVHIAASNCDRELNVQSRDGDAVQRKQEFQTLLKRLEDLLDISSSISVLQDKFDLAQLPVVKEAMFDSYEEQHNARCLEDSRVEILRHISEWANNPSSKCIFWLSGMAGTGKSTISRTVAQDLQTQNRLGPTFFFKRGEADRGNARKLFPTIVAQLAQKLPELFYSLAKALDTNPDIPEKSLKEQFDRLIFEQLQQISHQPLQATPLVAIIDALDECEQEQSVRTVLRLLSRVSYTTPISLRLFVTSRPELPIRLGFAEMDGEAHYDVELQKATEPTIERDITLYLQNQLAHVRLQQLKKQPHFPLPPDWPGDRNLRALLRLAIPLFIFAATVCRFIGDLKGNPRKRLDAVLQYPQTVSTSKLDQTYLPILDQLLIDQDEEGEGSLVKDIKALVAPIVLLFEPLSSRSLANLLKIPLEDVCDSLDWLHSVLSVPKDQDAPVRILHLSFRDFLVDPKKRNKNKFWVDEQATHMEIARKCLNRLRKPGCLKQNICNISEPGARRRNIKKHTIKRHIPAEVSYACRYWVYHLRESKQTISHHDVVHSFLEEHFLHWLEVLSWLGKLSDSISQINILQTLVVSKPALTIF